MPRLSPLNPMQQAVLQCGCDIVAITGSVKGGKTFVGSWLPARRIKHNIGLSTCYLRVNDRNFTDPGGFFDKFEDIYNLRIHGEDKGSNRGFQMGTLIKTMPAIARFINGYECHFKSVYRFDDKTLQNLFKTNETDVYVLDECEDMPWSVPSYIGTRLRGRDVTVPRQMYLIQNPERECFMRKIAGCSEMGAGYIDDDGYVIPEMNGQVRYFFNPKGSENEFYWGKTKQEVYDKCKHIIESMTDGKMNVDWEDAILSFAFFDLPIIDDDKKYLGRLLNSTGYDSVADVNWNHSKHDVKEDESNLALSKSDVGNAFREPKSPLFSKTFAVFDVAGAEGGEISATGKTRRGDNMTAGLFGLNQHGIHCLDITYWVNPDITRVKSNIREYRDKYKLSNSNLIIDIQGMGALLVGDFPTAKFVSTNDAISNKGVSTYVTAKAEAVGLTCIGFQNGIITINPELKNKLYKHSRMKTSYATIHSHMCFESRGIVFLKDSNGKQKLIPKEDIRKKHLRGFSQDLFDLFFEVVGKNRYDMYRFMTDAGAKNLRYKDAYGVNEEVTVPEMIESLKYKHIPKTFGQVLARRIKW